MKDIATVLAATDFSECAHTALGIAADTANLFGARLVVAHVLQNLDHTYSLLVDELQEEVEQQARRDLGDALDELRISRSRADSVLTKGSPVDALIRLALREHADLLVAGLMGSGCGSEEGALGSVVDRLLRCGLFDLYLVRRDETPGIQKLAVATDFSESAEEALETAASLAKRFGLDEITLIHAYELPQGYSKLGTGEAEVERHVRENVQTMFDELTASMPPPDGVRYEPELVRGSPALAIRQACQTRGVDLLVISSWGRTAAAAALIGNVALKIVREAPCSVWVSRPAGQTLTATDAIKRLMGMGD